MGCPLAPPNITLYLPLENHLEAKPQMKTVLPKNITPACKGSCFAFPQAWGAQG